MAAQNGFIAPMLAAPMPAGQTLADYAAGHIAQEKFDGHRIVMLVQDGTPYAWTRDQRRRSLPQHIQAAAAQLPDGYYDGELIARLGGKSYDISAGSNTGKELLALFDIVHVLGGSLLKQPYEVRRTYLETALEALDEGAPIFAPPHLAVSEDVIAGLWEQGREGVIIKRAGSLYRPGMRSPDWIKVKRTLEAEVTITGFDKGESGPHSVAAVMDAEGVRTRVRVPTNDLIRRIDRDPGTWIGTRIEIEFQERTPNSYRHPRWKRVVGGA